MKKQTSLGLFSNLNNKSKVIVLISLFTVFTTMAYAQTTALDSSISATDTLVQVNNSIVVMDSSGQATFFAGAIGGQFNGKVGVGTTIPTDKLTILDDTRSSFRLGQSFPTLSTAKGSSLLGSSGEPISNFEIEFIDLEQSFFKTGDVHQYSFTGDSPSFTGTQVTPTQLNQIFGVDHQCQSMTPDLLWSSYAFGWLTQQSPNQCPPFAEVLQMWMNNNGNLYVDKMATFNDGLITADGGVTVEATTNTKALKVNNAGTENFVVWSDGKVRAREVKVTLANPFPDYVFDKSYKLMPIQDLSNYIDSNKHLPGVTPATIVNKEGIDLGEQNRQLTEKVEELTLYLINQQKQLDALKEEMAQLKKQ